MQKRKIEPHKAIQRVVIIPGIMGSALRQKKFTDEEVIEYCRRHWRKYPALRQLLEENGYKLCGPDAHFIWGRLQFLHWLADPKLWLELIKEGDGYDIGGPITPDGPFDIDVAIRKIPWKSLSLQIAPYKKLISALHKKSADVLFLGYDWRLRLHQSGQYLEDKILEKWWPNIDPESLQGGIRPEEKLLLIGHSMGGLVSRLWIEDTAFLGRYLTRRLITTGTPHQGAPEAYVHFNGLEPFFPNKDEFQLLREIDNMGIEYSDPVTAEIDSEAEESPISLYRGDPDEWESQPISTHMLFKKQQKELVQSFASICQLMPSEPFIKFKSRKKGQKKEPLKTSYRDLSHLPTGRRLIDIHDELHSKLLSVSDLSLWLETHNILYDFLGANSELTIVGLEKDSSQNNKEIVSKKKQGDGTVPGHSAFLFAKPSPSERIKPVLIKNKASKEKGGNKKDSKEKGGNKKASKETGRNKKDGNEKERNKALLHNKLCEHPDVIKYCEDALDDEPIQESLPVIKNVHRKNFELHRMVELFKQAPDIGILSTHAQKTTLKLSRSIYNVDGSTDDPKIDGLSWKKLLESMEGGEFKNETCFVINRDTPTGNSHDNFSVGGHMTTHKSGYVKDGNFCYLMPLCSWHNSKKRDGVNFKRKKSLIVKLHGFMRKDTAASYSARIPRSNEDMSSRIIYYDSLENAWRVDYIDPNALVPFRYTRDWFRIDRLQNGRYSLTNVASNLREFRLL